MATAGESPAPEWSLQSEPDLEEARTVLTLLHRVLDKPADFPLTDEQRGTVVRAHDRLKQGQRERVELMQRYAEINACRREFLMRYFGEDFTGPCNNCDNDAASEGMRREVA